MNENCSCNLESNCTMSFDDPSGDLPLVFPVRIRLWFREPEVTLESRSQKLWWGVASWGPRRWKYISNLRFALAFDIYSQTDHASKNLSYFLLGNMIWFGIKHIELIVEVVWNIQFNLNYSRNLSKKDQSISSENFERKLGSHPSHLWQCFSIEVSDKGRIFN